MNFLGISNLSKSNNVNNIIKQISNHFTSKECKVLSFSDKKSISQVLNIWAIDEQYTNQSDFNIVESNKYCFLGKGFLKNTLTPISTKYFNESKTDNIETFLNKIDGEYILFEYNTDNISILRSPSSQIPIFYKKIENDEIIFSSKIEYISLFCDIADINWDYLCSFIIHGALLSNSSPFKECLELPFGCSLKLARGNVSINRAWKPENFFLNKCNSNSDEALVNDLELSLKQMTFGVEEIFVEFSSGVDSTSILFCLKNILQKNQTLHPIHFYNPKSKAANEIKLAGKICHSLKLPLKTFNFLDFLPFSFSKLPFKPDKPGNFLIYQELENAYTKVIPQNKTFKFVSGHGGDNLLLTPPPLELLSDFFDDKGFNGLNSKMLDLFSYLRTPFFQLVKEILIHKLKTKNYNYQKGLTWGNETINSFVKNKFVHPFFQEKLRIPAGKLYQIYFIYEGFQLLNLNLRAPGNYTAFPFLYQKMIETGLSIPTYDLFKKGFDRYPIRKGISKKFNTNLIWRKDKGEMSLAFQLGLKNNIEQILELCLEGNFARNKLIDRKKAHSAIISVCNGKHEEQWSIAKLIMAEVFLSYWQ